MHSEMAPQPSGEGMQIRGGGSMAPCQVHSCSVKNPSDCYRRTLLGLLPQLLVPPSQSPCREELPHGPLVPWGKECMLVDPWFPADLALDAQRTVQDARSNLHLRSVLVCIPRAMPAGVHCLTNPKPWQEKG